MKKFMQVFLSVLILLLVYVYREEIFLFYNQHFVSIEKKITKLEKNAYYRDYDFSYVQNTTDFMPNNKDDILNIYYTIVNNGMSDFTFYCDRDYKSCVNDVHDIADNQTIIANINNFVHPYNSFKSLKTEVDSTGRVHIEIERVYNDEMIILLNYKMEEILKEIKIDGLSEKDKIKKIHDYIINHTQYDKDRSDKKIIKYKSDNAYGVLIENYGLCGGYTDAMMLFLEKLDIKSIKISTNNHIWNYVFTDNKWLHLDLTWDDPVSSDGKDLLDDTYFLITDKTLQDIEKTEHNYDVNIYKN